jgi:hypothetical protein
MEGYIKINWDVFLDMLRKRIGVGVVARDHEGVLVSAMCATKDFIIEPTTVEAETAQKTVELSLQLGWQKLVLEGDVLEIVNILKQEEQ